MSDVPLGLFLSGGIDSGALAALVRASGHGSMRSVSITFDEEPLNEGPQARRVAERFGIDHVEQRVTSQDVLMQLDTMIAAMDQPSVDGINTYLVSRAAREAGLTVALSGLGADELFGGYHSFRTIEGVYRIMRGLGRLPAKTRITGLLAQSPTVPYRVRKLSAWSNSAASLESAYLAIRGLLSPDQAHELLPADSEFDARAYAQSAAPTSDLTTRAAVSLLESRLYMHNQLLRDTDAMSMAHSLEVRVPYLDEDVATLAARSHGFRPDEPKAALAAARSIYFPLALPSGPKRGFTLPFESWLRGPLAPVALETASSPRVLSTTGMRDVLNRFRRGRAHWSHVWAPVVLERWLEAHHVTVGGLSPVAAQDHTGSAWNFVRC